jgi:hypothetical protein
MFSENDFIVSVFIGGMGGIVQEFELFTQLQPAARIVPVLSTGGAALTLRDRIPHLVSDLEDDLDYVALFHRYLDVSPTEERYETPADQPNNPNDRIWISGKPPVMR